MIFVYDKRPDNFFPGQPKSFQVKCSRCSLIIDATIVTRFGEISPLWQNFKSLWLLFEGLFCIGQNVNLIGHIFRILGKFSLLLFAKY